MNRGPATPCAVEPATEVRETVVVANSRGLHARAAARFVEVACQFKSEVQVARRGTVVSGHSIMGLMMLAAGPGVELELRARGEDAAAVVAALTELVRSKFGED